MINLFTTPDLYAAALRLTIPLAFAALGGIFSEKAGVLNMTLEGYMLMGAFFAYFGSLYTDSPWLGIACAAFGGAVLALLHAIMTITLRTNQIVTALGLNMLAAGFTSTQFRLTFGIDQVQTSCIGLEKVNLGFLSDIPIVGSVLFSQNVMFYFLLILIPIMAYFMKRTSWGLAIHAAGEHPRALDVAGISVHKVRYWSVIACGVLAGIGGGTLVLGNLNLFYDNVTAGRGYIAFAAIVFGRYRPAATALTTLMFGFFDALQLRLQSFGGNAVPYQLFVALPYIVTLIALLIVGSAKGPSASGKAYSREHKNQ